MTLISGTQTYIYKLGKYVDGIWTEGTEETETFNGSIQPLNYKDIRSLEVGRQDVGKIKIYSDIELPVGSEIQEGDISVEKSSGALILWQSKWWEVIQEIAYQMNLISHYKYIAEYREVYEES